MDAFKLDGQVAVVTGAGKGIGRGIALCLAQAGADVVVAARTLADCESVAAEIEALGRRALPVSVDVTVTQQLEQLAETAKDFGGLDIWGRRPRNGQPRVARGNLRRGDSIGWCCWPS